MIHGRSQWGQLCGAALSEPRVSAIWDVKPPTFQMPIKENGHRRFLGSNWEAAFAQVCSPQLCIPELECEEWPFLAPIHLSNSIGHKATACSSQNGQQERGVFCVSPRESLEYRSLRQARGHVSEHPKLLVLPNLTSTPAKLTGVLHGKRASPWGTYLTIKGQDGRQRVWPGGIHFCSSQLHRAELGEQHWGGNWDRSFSEFLQPFWRLRRGPQKECRLSGAHFHFSFWLRAGPWN